MPHQVYTREELKVRLTERWDATPFWTATDAATAINRALFVWNALTGSWTQRIVVPTIPSDPFVPIPGSLVHHTIVRWAGQTLIPTTPRTLDLGQPNWRQERVTDGGSTPGRPRLWSAFGFHLIAIWPALTTSAQLEVDGIRRTPILLTDEATVDLGSEDVGVLLGYVVHDLALKAGSAILEQTAPAYVQFVEAAVQRNQVLRRTQWYRRFRRRVSAVAGGEARRIAKVEAGQPAEDVGA